MFIDFHSMSKKNKNPSSFQFIKNLQPKLAVSEGFYDGRFREKTVKDKKKETSKKKARHKINLSKELE